MNTPIAFATLTTISGTLFWLSYNFRDDCSNVNINNNGDKIYLTSHVPFANKCWDIHLSSLFRQKIAATKCEGIKEFSTSTSVTDYTRISNPNKLRYLLARLNLCSLPIPRMISNSDPIFDYKEMKNGLQNRKKDEEQLMKLKRDFENPAMEQKRNIHFVKELMSKFLETMYGKGVTESIRHKFLHVSAI